MKKRSHKTSFALTILFILTPLTLATAKESILTITDYKQIYNFSNKPVVRIIKGDNPLYKNREYNDTNWKVTSLPSKWQKIYPKWNGVCWYRIKVKLPSKLPNKTVGIRLGRISDTDEIYLNGELIDRTGKTEPERISAYDRKRIYELPSQHILPGKVNVISLRVTGFFKDNNGPYSGIFEVGPFAELQRDYFTREFLDLLFIIFYVSVALYFGFIFGRKAIDREYIIFSLFSLCTALYLFLWTQLKYILTDDFIFLKRIEYILLIALLPLLLEFITAFFKQRREKLHYIYFGSAVIAAVTILVTGDILLWQRILLYGVQPLWIIPVGIIIKIVSHEYKRDITAKYLLFSFFVVLVFFINDILIYRFVYDLPRLSNYGFLFMIFSTAKMMRSRFMDLYQGKDSTEKKSGRISVTLDSKSKLEEVLNYLKENYRSDISREGLAEAVGISPDYLGKIFKQYMGKKLNEHINELRIEEALELLKRDEESILDIAYAVGFESTSTFYRVFQNHTGLTPTAYQEKYLNKKIEKAS